MRVVLGACKKHGIVGCPECWASLTDEIWKKEEEQRMARELNQDTTSPKQPKMSCPICHSEMKVNMSFQMAKCQSNPCGFVINWSSIEHRISTTLRIAQAINRRQDSNV